MLSTAGAHWRHSRGAHPGYEALYGFRPLLTFSLSNGSSLSYGSACCIALMICRLGGEAHIASGCSGFDNALYLLVLEGFDQHIIAALLQDIEPHFGIAQA